MASHPLYAVRDYEAEVGQQVFVVPFPYILKAHVLVWVNDVPVNFTWLSDNTIKLVVPLPEAAIVRVKRRTPLSERLVDFQSANILTEADLDASALQLFYIQQETQDDLELGLIGNPNAVPIKGDKGDYEEMRYQWSVARPEKPAPYDPQPQGWATVIPTEVPKASLWMTKAIKDGALGIIKTPWTPAIRISGVDGYGAYPDKPVNPYGFIISASDTAVMGTWDSPTFEGYKQTRYYKTTVASDATQAPQFQESFYVGSVYGGFSDVEVQQAVRYAYWIRHENTKGELSPVSEGLLVTVKTPLDLREGWVGQEKLRADLRTKIELIDLPEVGLIDRINHVEDAVSASNDLIGVVNGKVGQLEQSAGSYVTQTALLAADFAKRTDLTAYVSNDNLTGKLSSYVTSTQLAGKDYATNATLTAYVKGVDLTNQLKSYVTSEALVNADFAKKTDLTAYVKTTALDERLSSYITSTALANEQFAKKSDLVAYVKDADVNTKLSAYVKSDWLATQDYAKNSTLTAYVKDTSLTQKLASYVTTEALTGYDYASNSSLTAYVKQTSLTTQLSSYVTTQALTNANYAKSSDLTAYVTSTSLNTRLESYVSNQALASYQYATTSQLTAVNNDLTGKYSAVEQKATAAANEAYYSVKVQANGKVAGYGLTSNPQGTAILFSADQIGFDNGSGGAILPFSVRNGIVYMRDARVETIEANSIVNVDNVNGSVKKAQLGNTFIEGDFFLSKKGQIRWNDLDPEFRERLVLISKTANTTGGTRLVKGTKDSTRLYAAQLSNATNPPITSGGLSVKVSVQAFGGRTYAEAVGDKSATSIPKVTLTVYRKAVNSSVVETVGSVQFIGEVYSEQSAGSTIRWSEMNGYQEWITAGVNGVAYEYYVDLSGVTGTWGRTSAIYLQVDEEVKTGDALTVNLNWNSVLGKPTTLGGYGITDALSTSGGTVNGNATFNAPVTTKRTLYVSTNFTGQDDWINSPISVLERDNVNNTQSANKYAPNINFHWRGFVSNSLWMTSGGVLCWGAYDDAGTPNADGIFSTSLVYGSAFSTSGKGGMVLYNGTAGMVIRTQDSGGGYARGMIAENSAGTRLAGLGFYGGTDSVSSFAVSFKSDWWVAPQFEILPNNNINLNSTYLTLTQGWDISWGGRWTNGYPTITGNMGALYLYPNGSSGGAYNLTSSKLEFPVPFDAYMAPAGGGFHGFLTRAGNAKSVAVGGLLVSAAYSDVSSVPTNGMIVRGSSVIGGNAIDTAALEYAPSRSQLQIYSTGGQEARLAFHRGGNTVTTLVHDGNGLYLTNGSLRADSFGIKGRSTTITQGQGNADAISVKSPYGYIDIGALNSSFAHITTDRANFYMNKQLSAAGGFDVYGTQWFFGRESKGKIGSFQTRHIDGLSPDGTLYDSLYINYMNNNDVVIGRDGGARLIANSTANQVMARWVSSEDARSVGLRAPNAYINMMTYEFLDGAVAGNSGESYIGSMVFRPYGQGSDWSGGGVHKIHFGMSGRMWYQKSNGNSWGEFEEFTRYASNGYLYAKGWINIPNGNGLFYNNGTHLYAIGDGKMVLQGNQTDSYLKIRTSYGDSGYLYADYLGQMGFLNVSGNWMFRVNHADEVGGRAYDGAGNKYMKWSDFKPNMPPPAGLEGVISASWLSAGVVQANLIASGGLNVVDGGNQVSINPKATTPILFTKDGKQTFYVNIDGTGFFAGKLAKDTVDAHAITDDAKRAIYPYYVGGGVERVDESVATMANGAVYALTQFTTLQERDRVALDFSFQDAAQTMGITYGASTYTVYLERQVGSSSGGWTPIKGWTMDVTVRNIPARGYPEPEPAVGSYSYSLYGAYTDQIPAGTNSWVAYRIRVELTKSGSNTNSGIIRKGFRAKKAGFVTNTFAQDSTQTRWVDKETGFTIITGRCYVNADSQVTVNFNGALTSVISWMAQRDFTNHNDWAIGAASATTTSVTVYNQHTAGWVNWTVHGFTLV